MIWYYCPSNKHVVLHIDGSPNCKIYYNNKSFYVPKHLMPPTHQIPPLRALLLLGSLYEKEIHT